MWPFNSKESKVLPIESKRIERWRVPDDKAEEFCRLYDEMMEDEDLKLPNFRFWKFADGILPKHFLDCTRTIDFDDEHPVIEVEIVNQ